MQILVLLLKSEKYFFENCRNPRNNLRYFAEIREKYNWNECQCWLVNILSHRLHRLHGRRSASGRWRRTSFDYSHIVYIKRSSSSYASSWLLIIDYWLLMTDDYWWLIIRTLSIFSSAHQATQVSDWWWLMSNEQGSGSGLGWKPILLVTVGKCDSICPRVTTSISHPLAGSQYL